MTNAGGRSTCAKPTKRKPKQPTMPPQPFGVPLWGYEHPGCL